MRPNLVVSLFLFFFIQSAIFSVENQNNKEIPSVNRNMQTGIEEYPLFTDKLSVGEIAFGFRKNNITIPLLNKMKTESVSFQTHALKDFFLLVFRGISDSASIRLSLSDYKLISKDGSVACCKGFDALFSASEINGGGSFNINDSVGFCYGGNGKYELFTCLLFVIDKQAKNMRMLYKNHISGVIQELDANAIERDSLYYKDESADFTLTSLMKMRFYDKDSFSIYGAYPVQKEPVAVVFVGSKEFEVNDITRYTEDLVIATVTLKNNSCASDDSLVLDETFRAAIKTEDDVWTDSKGVVLELADRKSKNAKVYGLCNYVEESSNLKFSNSVLTLAKGTKIRTPFFPEYINCHINKIKRNAFRSVIPLVFQITEDRNFAAFKFSDFPEIQLAGIDILSKITKGNTPSQYKNSLTVINKTGKVAFVKIANIATQSIAELRIVANNDSCTFYLPNGRYREFVRLGCEPPFDEFKGEDEMNLTASVGSFLEASLTLQPVIGGTHPTNKCEPDEFDGIGK